MTHFDFAPQAIQGLAHADAARALAEDVGTGDLTASLIDPQRRVRARVLVRGGRYEALEGDARPRNVVIEFDSYDQARAYFYSPEYQAAREHRVGVSQGEFLLVEGFDPA